MNINNCANFRNPSTHTLSNLNGNNGYNYTNAYQQNCSMISKTNYKNTNNFLHNNLRDNILSERVETYSIFIDGYHRNHSSHKNPFKFPINFGSTGDNEKEHWDEIDQEIKIVKYQGDTGVRFAEYFNNIKFLRIHNLICPKYTKINYDFTNKKFVYVTDNEFDLELATKYIVFKIEELECHKRLTSGDFLKNDSFILRFDKNMGNNHMLLIPINRDIIDFKDSQLENLSRINVSVYNDEDNILSLPTLTFTDQTTSSINSIEFNFDTIISNLNNIINNINTSSGNTVNPFTGIDNNISDIKSTIKQIEKIKRKYQIQINLDIGIIENEMNVHTNYEK